MSTQSPHWKIVEQIVEERKVDPSVIAISVFGSMARGEERPDSDIDIEIVSTTEPEWRMAEEVRDGLVVDYVYTPKSFLEQKVAKYPFLSFVHTKEKVLYDPHGLMANVQQTLNEYFKQHPEVVTFWEEKIALMKSNKKQGIHDPQGGVRAYDEAEVLFSDTHTVTRTFWRE